ncbi:MAG TPA: ABC transporter ATP-binding protein [Xanthobacteraceae bacterium]|jgi:NitT/TauT family transport system ATP-binding protein
MRAPDNSLLSLSPEGRAPIGVAHSSSQSRLAAASAAVSVDHLSKAFRGKPAVSDISFSARHNQFVSIVGPSGCGKTTVLKMIAGLVEPTSGSVVVNGEKVEAPLRNASMVFQSPVLMPWRTVLGNVLFCIELRGDSAARYRAQALDLVKLAGLSGFENHYPHQLSGGMQQRVSICRALLVRPSLLLMDEPFGALDVLTRERMGFELQKLWSLERYTALFVTHSITEAVLLSDSIVVMPGMVGRMPAVTIEVDLPRPRDADIMKHAHFIELAALVREQIEAGWAGQPA